MSISLKNKKIEIKYPIFLILLITLSLFCCSQKHKVDLIEELEFNVDSTLIGKLYVNKSIGISFHPPLNWNIIPSQIFEKLENLPQLAIPDSANISLQTQQIFLDNESKSICFLSKLHSFSDNVTNRYKSIVTNRFTEGELKESIFTYNDFYVSQLLFVDDKAVVFKLIVEKSSDTFFVLDYIIPKIVYENQVKLIESSIGTLKKTNY